MSEQSFVAEREEAATGLAFSRAPDVHLNSSAAQTLSMGLHELATNAAKYGALSDQHGCVDVCWTRDGAPRDPALVITWTKGDGPRVAPRERQGFGSRPIERGIAQDLDGEVSLDFKPQDVRCSIRLPISERINTS